MSRRYYACVYAGASNNIKESIKSEVRKLGNIIAQNDFSLVYGAGATGCMGAVAEGVKEKGGYVMGISPYFIEEFEDIFPCDNTVMVDTMAERKTLMEKHGDIYFIVPGGIGTMDEFFQILTLKYLNRTTAPIVIVNLEGFFDNLINLLEDLVCGGAAGEKIRGLFDVVNSVDEELIGEYFDSLRILGE